MLKTVGERIVGESIKLPLETLAVIALLAAAAAVILVSGKGRGKERARSHEKGWKEARDEHQYQEVLRKLPYKKKQVFNKSEYLLYMSVVSLARENGWIVLAQVRLADFVSLDDGHDYEKSALDQRAWREISQKHVDILIVDRNSKMPVAAVECDGPLHLSNTKTMRNDQFKDAVAAKTGFVMVRVPASNRLGDASYVKRELASSGVVMN